MPPGGLPGYTYVDSGVPSDTITGGLGPTQGGQGMVTVFAGVEDVQAAMDKAVALGARVVQPAASVPALTFRLFADPQGNVIGVASQDA